MLLTSWLTIAGICCLGAMSPGPSLAVVLKHTISGSRNKGISAAIAHGLGVGLYAFACISGVALVIVTSETLFTALKWSGAAYLAWLGIKGLLSKSNPNQNLPEVNTKDAIRDGFMVVFLNPKIAVFFIAIFSQVIGTDTTVIAKVIYASTAMIIDGGWYVIVAWVFSNERWLEKLQRKAIWLDRCFGLILLSLAIQLVLEML
jgi:threonine/homoserine/homoserine lactone efflux protein